MLPGGNSIWGIRGLFGERANPIATLLGRDDCTLETLLDEDELLQELNTNNDELAEFLANPEVVRKMIRYAIYETAAAAATATAGADSSADDSAGTASAAAATAATTTEADASTAKTAPDAAAATENKADDDTTADKAVAVATDAATEEEGASPDATADVAAGEAATESDAGVSDQDFTHYSRRCTEVFCCDVEAIMEQLLTQGPLFELLLEVLARPSPLHPRVAANFRKVLEALARSNPQQFLSLLNSRAEALAKQFLQHTDSFSVMGLYRMLLQLPHDMRQVAPAPFADPTFDDEPAPLDDTVVWGNRASFVTQLVDRLGSPAASADTPANRVTHNNITTVVCGIFAAEDRLKYLTEASGQALLELAFSAPAPSCRIAAFKILHQIFSLPSEADSVQHFCIQQLAKQGDKVAKLLAVDASTLKHRVANTGKKVPILGAERLHLAQMCCKALATGYHGVAEALAKTGLLGRLCDLFLTFKWNSLLHGSVGPAIKNVIGLSNNAVNEHLFKTYPFLNNFMDTYTEDTAQSKKCIEPANHGWMHEIFNQIVQVSETGPDDSVLRTITAASARWKAFAEKELDAANKKDDSSLGGVDPNMAALGAMMLNGQPDSYGGAVGVPLVGAGGGDVEYDSDDSDSDGVEDPEMLARYGLSASPSAPVDDDDYEDAAVWEAFESERMTNTDLNPAGDTVPPTPPTTADTAATQTPTDDAAPSNSGSTEWHPFSGDDPGFDDDEQPATTS